ncbi:hypothetical protein DPEC_G00319890 [Dallia pectoralis]|uniref:Uncharacterized protein n=1 Tax=Dallia pectoralis TaxID=75939 RepID=A0ACC2F9S1_DALPE|nr:hypothetical protein DPEC_G00319890 [Dallia pectoralis]
MIVPKGETKHRLWRTLYRSEGNIPARTWIGVWTGDLGLLGTIKAFMSVPQQVLCLIWDGDRVSTETLVELLHLFTTLVLRRIGRLRGQPGVDVTAKPPGCLRSARTSCRPGVIYYQQLLNLATCDLTAGSQMWSPRSPKPGNLAPNKYPVEVGGRRGM